MPTAIARLPPARPGTPTTTSSRPAPGRARASGRVHRRAADRRPPHPGQRDIAADADGGQRPDLLGTRRSAQDHARPARWSGPVPTASRWSSRSAARAGSGRAALLADQRPQQQRGQHGTDQLGHDVGRYPLPRESPRNANATLTGGFRCAPETVPMNKMMAATISAGATTRAPYGTALPPKRALTMPLADGDQNQEEGPRATRRTASTLIAVVPEVELGAPSSAARRTARRPRHDGPPPVRPAPTGSARVACHLVTLVRRPKRQARAGPDLGPSQSGHHGPRSHRHTGDRLTRKRVSARAWPSAGTRPPGRPAHQGKSQGRAAPSP